ncbi:hypothetical protein [Natrarchaeobaculum sulfurireducens]|uniref:Uncharacterized protein n=2 Tax=Natrarchaeobaculum sulfurireducens TaxID=2044521 RepID=A0A346PUK1_9EURY|nr:hypothetical protein [Natrarchaeobaculum sulfurireducens]AXR83196.1 hypothetical protein AArcMg_3211 [Natrarchaeobaculum sulfurireducens]
MTSTRAVALLVILAVAGVAFAPAASGAVATGIGDADQPAVADGAATSEDESPSENGSSNASVSAFMQSNAAQAEYTVESGMFDAAFENAANESRADVVVDRTAILEDRVDALEAERDELQTDGNLSEPEHQARLTRLTVELASLNQSIDRAEHRANESGVDGERLGALRSNASALAGPDVAETARGLAGVDGHPGASPPADERSSSGQSAAQSGANDDDSGPPEERPSDRDVPNEEREGSPTDDADETDGADADEESSAEQAGNSSTDVGGGPPDDAPGQ